MKKRVFMWIGLILTTGITAAILIYGTLPPHLTFGNDGIRVNGMYGVTIEYCDIAEVSFTDGNDLPHIKYRTNGLGFFGTDKGYFKTSDGEKLRLFRHRKATGPYIVITGKNGFRTIFRTENGTRAEKIYDAYRHSPLNTEK